MANYTTVRNRMNSYSRAASLLVRLKAIHMEAQFAQAAINDYTNNIDADFVVAINSIFTPAERAQLGTMLTQLNSLVTAWNTNHATLLSTQTEL